MLSVWLFGCQVTEQRHKGQIKQACFESMGIIELKDSSGQPVQGMLVKNNNNGRAQRFVILLHASMCGGS